MAMADHAGPGAGPSGGRGRFLGADQIEAALRELRSEADRAGARFIVVGGVAMQRYGSPRLTADIDCAADRPLADPTEVRRLTFGGSRLRLAAAAVEADWILRNDEYAALYAEAVERPMVDADGTPFAAPAYLAAMKLAARRGKDTDDLLYLITSGALDLDAARDVITRLVGGRFARDEFDSIVAEAEWRRREAGG
jgi:hypothetical protein